MSQLRFVMIWLIQFPGARLPVWCATIILEGESSWHKIVTEVHCILHSGML